MQRFEKQVEKGHFEEKGLGFNRPGQRSASKTENLSAIKKELGEDSYAKASMMELLVDHLVGQLSLPENYAIIDEAFGEEGACQELAGELWKYSGHLGTIRLNEHSSARDILGNFETEIFLALRQFKKGREPDYWKRVLAEKFGLLKAYVELLKSDEKFEARELGGESGFLGGRFDKNELLKIRTNRAEYIEKCREIIAREKELKKAA